jgi:hypothetical protein
VLLPAPLDVERTLVLGFAQQALTRLLDKQAESLLAGLPSKDAAEQAPQAPPTRPAPSVLDGDGARPRVPTRTGAGGVASVYRRLPRSGGAGRR